MLKHNLLSGVTCYVFADIEYILSNIRSGFPTKNIQVSFVSYRTENAIGKLISFLQRAMILLEKIVTTYYHQCQYKTYFNI